MKNEKGFTLIEVLASLVIISIVLTSFMAIFSNTNALAVSNSEKLVVINLADAYLERMKANPSEFITYKEPKDNCANTKKSWEEKEPFTYSINEKEYEISVNATQAPGECSLSLINIIVEVTAVESSLSSKVEGYVLDVKKNK